MRHVHQTASAPAEPYYRRLKRLRHEKGLSQAELFRRAHGVGFDTIRAIEQDPNRTTSTGQGRARYPSADTLAAVAAALDVDPAEFPEYRLARAREHLDERTVGLERALDTLATFERAVTPGAAGGPPEPPGALGRELQETPPNAKNQPRTRRRRAQGGQP